MIPKEHFKKEEARIEALRQKIELSDDDTQSLREIDMALSSALLPDGDRAITMRYSRVPEKVRQALEQMAKEDGYRIVFHEASNGTMVVLE